MDINVTSYSPEMVEVYIDGDKSDRVSGFAVGQAYEISDKYILIRLHCGSDHIEKLDMRVGKRSTVNVKIQLTRESNTTLLEYLSDGVVSRKIVGGIDAPIFEYKFSGNVEKI